MRCWLNVVRHLLCHVASKGLKGESMPHSKQQKESTQQWHSDTGVGAPC
jgi:hypothetical protein